MRGSGLLKWMDERKEKQRLKQNARSEQYSKEMMEMDRQRRKKEQAYQDAIDKENNKFIEQVYPPD
jgi:hypothetical protein